jgi:multiple sugar transport system permease protein/putative chitobiose transport system permease protein
MAASKLSAVVGPHRPAANTRKILSTALRWLIYAVLLVIFLMPFVWMVFGSVRAENEIFRFLFPFSIRTFIPVQWTLDSFLTILGLNELGRASGYDFGRNLFNSFLVSVAVVLSSLVFNTMGAYFFARLPFPKKNWLLLYVIATLLVPFEVTMVPLYIVVRNLHLDNTLWALIVPWYASPFVIFSLMQFMRETIPYDLDEAALMDGAGYGTVLWRIIVPNAIPGLVTNALLEFQFIWNLFYWPLIAIGDRKLQVLQVAISGTLGQTQQYWGRTFAGSVLASAPVILIFLLLQRYYVQGVATTGVKG